MNGQVVLYFGSLGSMDWEVPIGKASADISVRIWFMTEVHRKAMLLGLLYQCYATLIYVKIKCYFIVSLWKLWMLQTYTAEKAF